MSALASILARPAIPFQRKVDERNIRKVTLSSNVTAVFPPGTFGLPTREKRTASLIVADGDDVETMIRLFLEFQEASGSAALDLDNPSLYVYFRKCLGGIALETYDNLLVEIDDRSNENFRRLLSDLLASFCDSTVYLDQKRYIDNFQKPFKMSVRELSNRLVIINKYSSLLPGSQGNRIFNRTELKYALFNMVRPEWQLAFAGSSQVELGDDAYTYEMLLRFLITQERLDQARLENFQRKSDPTRYGRRDGRGRGFRPNHFAGRFGRGFSRSFQSTRPNGFVFRPPPPPQQQQQQNQQNSQNFPSFGKPKQQQSQFAGRFPRPTQYTPSRGRGTVNVGHAPFRRPHAHTYFAATPPQPSDTPDYTPVTNQHVTNESYYMQQPACDPYDMVHEANTLPTYDGSHNPSETYTTDSAPQYASYPDQTEQDTEGDTSEDPFNSYYAQSYDDYGDY